MSWTYGIPDFVGNYVYFKSLYDVSHNTPNGVKRKKLLTDKIDDVKKVAMTGLTDTAKIEQANKFLASVATNERNKEMDMIRSFCNKTGKQFPALQPYLNNPKLIQDDPQAFYAELTNAINIVRRGTRDYLNDLNRIKMNMLDTTRTLENYKADDYRYRFVGDVSSFINRLRGRYNDIEDVNQYSLKIQNIVMEVLDETGFLGQITDGVEFAAVAASLLGDLESKVQAEIDKQISQGETDRDIARISEDALAQFKNEYIDKINAKDKAMNPVERAISDINGIDFQRIVQNGKELLGLKTMHLDSKELKKHTDKIRKRDSRLKNNSISKLRQDVSKNMALKKDLSLIEFSIKGSVNTKHGSLFELLDTIMFGGRNVTGEGATDVITATIGWEFSRNESAVDLLLSQMSEAITDAVMADDPTPSNLRDLTDDLAHMNEQIDIAIKECEEQLRNLTDLNLDEVFVYHESLKLYSSMEGNGRGSGTFHGRNMNILSYIDYMASSSVSESSSLIINKEELSFLGLNLMKDAVAESAVAPLEAYFSMYAGLLMFDDLTNMAMEAVTTVEGNKKTGPGIIQIHLYNLNGIFVPASMLLSYVADTVEAAGRMINSGMAAKAHITVPKKNDAYQAYLNRVKNGERKLRPKDWQNVAAEAGSNTKVSITFLSSFLNFIQQL